MEIRHAVFIKVGLWGIRSRDSVEPCRIPPHPRPRAAPRTHTHRQHHTPHGARVSYNYLKPKYDKYERRARNFTLSI